MKTTRPPIQPRKRPTQERSRATVDAITQAAAYILVRQGWEKLTTNAIAERSGVNIGSIYQYFPSKEAIVAELHRRHIAETRGKVAQALSQLPAQRSLREALALLARAVVEEHRVAPAVHRVFSEELPRSARCVSDDESPVHDFLLRALQPFMKNVPDPKFAIQIVQTVVHAVIHDATVHRPGDLDRPDLVDEIVALCTPYLQRPK